MKQKHCYQCGGREEIMEMLNNTHKNAEIYEKISKEMSVLGYQRDLIQCRTKVKHLKTEYKKYKDALWPLWS